MGKHLRKAEAKLNARLNAARQSKDERSRGRGGGGFADSKHAAGINMPGSMRMDK